MANGDLLAYMREAAGDRLLVVLNLGAGQVRVALPPGGAGELSWFPRLPAATAKTWSIRSFWVATKARRSRSIDKTPGLPLARGRDGL